MMKGFLLWMWSLAMLIAAICAGVFVLEHWMSPLSTGLIMLPLLLLGTYGVVRFGLWLADKCPL
jgi:hypothetical protein